MKSRSPEEKEKHRLYNKEWRLRNPERERANNAAWRAKNPGLYADYYRRNQERRRAESAAYRLAHPEKHKAAVDSWRERNKEHEKAYRKEYRAKNPELMRTLAHKRYARKVGNGGRGVSPSEWAGLLEQFNHCCAYCGRSGPLERDHVYPINLGGKDEAENVVPACRGCNAKKRSSKPIQWMLKHVA